MKNIFWIFFIFITSLQSEAVEVKSLKNSQLFGIEVEQGLQEFYGRADSLNSVSLQSYLTSSYRVTEMVLDMHGSPLQLRIYHTALIDPKQEAARLKQSSGLQSVGIPKINMPTPLQKGIDGVNTTSNSVLFKEYPLTTHAKTIEFQISSQQELIELYKTVRDHWLRLAPQENETASPQEQTVVPARLNGRLFIVTQ